MTEVSPPLSSDRELIFEVRRLVESRGLSDLVHRQLYSVSSYTLPDKSLVEALDILIDAGHQEMILPVFRAMSSVLQGSVINRQASLGNVESVRTLSSVGLSDFRCMDAAESNLASPNFRLDILRLLCPYVNRPNLRHRLLNTAATRRCTEALAFLMPDAEPWTCLRPLRWKNQEAVAQLVSAWVSSLLETGRPVPPKCGSTTVLLKKLPEVKAALLFSRLKQDLPSSGTTAAARAPRL